MNKLPIGTIFMSNNTRLIIVKNNQNGYIVCPCSETEITINQQYIVSPSQIEKLLSLGYVDLTNSNQNLLQPFSNNVVPTNINTQPATTAVQPTSNVAAQPVNSPNQPTGNQTVIGGFIFDENGFVIGEQ